MSKQHTAHTLSKHNPACLRIALNISSFTEPWCMAQCGNLQVSRVMGKVTLEGQQLAGMK